MTLTRAFAALTGASAVSLAAQLVRGKLAALLLGPAGVGIFNQLSLMWNLFNVAGGLGSFLGVVHHGAEAIADQNAEALRRLSSTFVLLLGSVSCVLALLGVLFSLQLSNFLLHDGGQNSDLVALMLISVPIAVTAQTYHAILSAAQAVRQLVKMQIITDVGATIVFAGLIIPLGLRGAVIGFMATYVIMFVTKGFALRRVLGSGLLLPSPNRFSWSVVRNNVGFGASGLIMIVLGNLSVLFVSRLVIVQLGIEANGIFSNAWRVASVYLGAVTATGFAYYLPTITRCKTATAMQGEVNATLRFYLYALPLLMAGILTVPEILVWLILSEKFLPVVPLLLIFVPAELVRILAETASMPLLARKRMKLFTCNFCIQVAVFVAGGVVLLPIYGLVGAVIAYGLSMLAYILSSTLVVRTVLDISLERSTAQAGLAAGALLGVVSAASFALPLGLPRVLIAAIGCGMWLLFALRNRTFRDLFRKHRS